MKRLINAISWLCVIAGLISLLFVPSAIFLRGLAHGGEKEEMQWRHRALVAEFNAAQQRLPELRALQAAQQRMPEFKALQEFGMELDKKGYMIDASGQIVEKPKDVPRSVEPKPALKVPTPAEK